MIASLFNTYLYDPLYNALIFLVGVVPAHDVGIAVIVLTILVRIVLFPLAKRAVETQMAMKSVAPEIEVLKKKYKDDREQQSRAIFALYKERGIHPFAGIGLVLLQFPILIALYWVFSHGGLPEIHTDTLYGFVVAPDTVNMLFLGLIPMNGHSIILAFTAGLSQLLYARLSMGPAQTADPSPVESTLSGEMAKSFDMQARYILPVFIGVIGYTVVAAAPLYWTASNIFMIAQEYIGGKRF